MSTIDITNCGPVAHISIPVPESGGVVVLKGRNGSGKTKTLEAVETAITGRGNIDVRDGALRGEVEAFGVSIKVGRSKRRTGELEVTSLEGRLSVSELVDPGMKSPDAADARRIKALVQLANVEPSAELFYSLVGGREEFEKLVGTTALASDDLVTMADRIKRDLEKAARNEESQAEHAEGRARGAREAASGVTDITVECDATKLQSKLEEAIKAEESIKARFTAAANAAELATVATMKLERAEAEYSGPSFAAAQQAVEAAKLVVELGEKALRDAETALERARGDYEAARRDYSHAISAQKSAEQHEAMLADWKKILSATIPEAPSTKAREYANEAVTVARKALEQGALVRAAKQHLEEAAIHAEQSVTHRTRAELLRDAARGTDEILSSVVAKSGSPLRVEAGRLVLDTRRGATYFADLSMGERWKMALDIAIEAVGENGVLTISQEAWEALDPINRREVAEHVQGRGVLILTAECSDDDEITAEVFE